MEAICQQRRMGWEGESPIGLVVYSLRRFVTWRGWGRAFRVMGSRPDRHMQNKAIRFIPASNSLLRQGWWCRLAIYSNLLAIVFPLFPGRGRAFIFEL